MNQLVNVVDVTKLVWTNTKSHAIEASADASIALISEKVVFIPPKLKTIKAFEGGSIIIISAPGAVGKTTFAKHFAKSKKAVYWDLAKIKLGDNSFLGTLAKTFGANNLSQIITELANGEISLFIDAFDEAEIISGWDGVEKFIRELYSFCNKSTHPNIVLFSRSETAEFLQMTFDEVGGTKCYSMFEIEYFDRDGAIQFIEEFLKNQEIPDLSFNTHKIPFENAINNIFDAISIGMDGQEKDIWQNYDVRSFIGYSPVLQTIGSFLYKQNFEEIANQYSQQKSSDGGIKVIAQFIESLLIREQNKVIESIKATFKNIPKDWDSWGTIYTPKEQMQTIVSYLSSGRRIDPILHTHIPLWLKKEYSEAIETFLPNHPFLRKGEFGPAFRDYALGQLLNDQQFEEICKRYMNVKNIVLTPLFAHFYLKFNGNTCKGTHAGFIYESAAAKRGYDENILMTFIKPNFEGRHTLEIINSEGQKAGNLEIDCLIDDKTPLVFERRLHHATISIDGELILGKIEASMELSDLDLRAKKITIKSKELLFNCHNNQNTIIKAKAFKNENYALAIKKVGTGIVQINWPEGDVYPWGDYYTDIPDHSDDKYQEELFALRRILEPFRKHGRNEFAKQSEFIENRMVGDVPLRKDMLAFLINKKILTKNTTDMKYYLNDQVMEQNGINWSSLKSLKSNESIKSCFADFKKEFPSKK